MISRQRLAGALIVVAAALAAAAGPASAATTVGQAFTPSYTCSAIPFTLVQVGVAGGNSYAVPTDGVITSWSFQSGATVPSDLKLRVLRATEPENKVTSPYLVVGESPAGLITAFAANARPARISVQAGDVLGIFLTGGSCLTRTELPADQTLGWGDILVGTVHYNGYPEDGSRLPVSASVELDADRDGYGDETQDGCPADTSTQGPCPDHTPPETTIAKGPKKKTTKARAVFELASSEAGSSFECQLDGKFSFAACGAKEALKVAIGKHSLAVRATDAAGNTDPTPALRNWKVIKKKKKKRKRHPGR